MNEERCWERIIEDVRVLADKHNVDVPQDLIVTTGDYWERNDKKRTALQAFCDRLPGPTIATNQPLDALADQLDAMVLSLLPSNDTAEKTGRRRKQPVEDLPEDEG